MCSGTVIPLELPRRRHHGAAIRQATVEATGATKGAVLMWGENVFWWSWCQGRINISRCFQVTLNQSHHYLIPAALQLHQLIFWVTTSYKGLWVYVCACVCTHACVCGRTGGFRGGRSKQATKLLTDSYYLLPYSLDGAGCGGGASETQAAEADPRPDLLAPGCANTFRRWSTLLLLLLFLRHRP